MTLFLHTGHADLRLTADRRTLTDTAGEPQVTLPRGLSIHEIRELVLHVCHAGTEQPTLEHGLEQLRALSSDPAAVRVVLNLRARARQQAAQVAGWMARDPDGQAMQRLMLQADRLQRQTAAVITPSDKAAVTRARKLYEAALDDTRWTHAQVTLYLRYQQVVSRLLVMADHRASADASASRDARQARIRQGHNTLERWDASPAAAPLRRALKQAQRSLESRHDHPDLHLDNPRTLCWPHAERNEKHNTARLTDHHTTRNAHRNPRRTEARYSSHLTRYNRLRNRVSDLKRSARSSGWPRRNRERLRLRRTGVPLPSDTQHRAYTRPDRLQTARSILAPSYGGPGYTADARVRERRLAQHTLACAMQDLSRKIRVAAAFKGKAVRERHLNDVLEWASAHPLLALKLDLHLRAVRRDHDLDLGARPRWSAPVPHASGVALQPGLF